MLVDGINYGKPTLYSKIMVKKRDVYYNFKISISF